MKRREENEIILRCSYGVFAVCRILFLPGFFFFLATKFHIGFPDIRTSFLCKTNINSFNHCINHNRAPIWFYFLRSALYKTSGKKTSLMTRPTMKRRSKSPRQETQPIPDRRANDRKICTGQRVRNEKLPEHMRERMPRNTAITRRRRAGTTETLARFGSWIMIDMTRT